MLDTASNYGYEVQITEDQSPSSLDNLQSIEGGPNYVEQSLWIL